MSVTLLASACPVPPAFDAAAHPFLRIADAGGSSGNAPTSINMAAGDITFRQTTINPNATANDLRSRYGGGIYGIAHGLTITSVSGTTVKISAGHAMIDGIVELASDITEVVADSHPGPADRAWIYLLTSGAPQIEYNTLTPPAAACCLLGSVTTSGGVVTSIDFSGVVYLKGGIGYRQTADPGAPTDTPNALHQFVHETAFGQYLWTGTAYKQIAIPQVSADPATPQNGDVWFRTDTLTLKTKSGGTVVPAVPAAATSSVHSASAGASATLDFSTYPNQAITLTANSTFTFTAPAAGTTVNLTLIQDATGSRTVTWPASVKWGVAGVPTLSTNPTWIDYITLYYDGSRYIGKLGATAFT